VEFNLPSLFASQSGLQWNSFLRTELQADYFIDLQHFLGAQYSTGVVFPPQDVLFRAFALTPLSEVKVVILGQDPYHGDGQAKGLAFSVRNGQKLPPSLKNIYKEVKTDVECEFFELGDLTSWALQGVLLLNSTLSVKKGSPASHQKQGWERFTDAVIKNLSEQKEDIVFLLWGNYARAKKELINHEKHLVLESVHPSPFSARNGFFGCKHFSKTNEFLQQKHSTIIDWST
jgi:uracil-DNA glycosylase